jgi:hypothetical protein
MALEACSTVCCVLVLAQQAVQLLQMTARSSRHAALTQLQAKTQACQVILLHSEAEGPTAESAPALDGADC